jgi:hypothetical protein
VWTRHGDNDTAYREQFPIFGEHGKLGVDGRNYEANFFFQADLKQPRDEGGVMALRNLMEAVRQKAGGSRQDCVSGYDFCLWPFKRERVAHGLEET